MSRHPQPANKALSRNPSRRLVRRRCDPRLYHHAAPRVELWRHGVSNRSREGAWAHRLRDYDASIISGQQGKLAKESIIPLNIFGQRSTIAALLTRFCHGFTYISAGYFFPLCFQSVAAVSPLRSGMLVVLVAVVQSVTYLLWLCAQSRNHDVHFARRRGLPMWNGDAKRTANCKSWCHKRRKAYWRRGSGKCHAPAGNPWR